MTGTETYLEVNPCTPQCIVQRRDIRRVYRRLRLCGLGGRSDDRGGCRLVCLGCLVLCLALGSLGGGLLVRLLGVLWVVCVSRLRVMAILIMRIWSCSEQF